MIFGFSWSQSNLPWLQGPVFEIDDFYNYDDILIFRTDKPFFFEGFTGETESRYSRDANLWRPKIGRLSFFLSPPEFRRHLAPPPRPPPPLPPHTHTQRKIDPAPNGNDLGHYMTSYMTYILSKFECLK